MSQRPTAQPPATGAEHVSRPRVAGQAPGPGRWEHRTQWEDISSMSHLPAHARENLDSVPSEEPKVSSHLGDVAHLV